MSIYISVQGQVYINIYLDSGYGYVQVAAINNIMGSIWGT